MKEGVRASAVDVQSRKSPWCDLPLKAGGALAFCMDESQNSVWYVLRECAPEHSGTLRTGGRANPEEEIAFKVGMLVRDLRFGGGYY